MRPININYQIQAKLCFQFHVLIRILGKIKREIKVDVLSDIQQLDAKRPRCL